MAIALSLIVELAEMIQRGVEWLAGGPAPRQSADADRDEPPAQRQRTVSPAGRAARVVRVATGGIVVSGRVDEVSAELDRLAAH